MTKIIWLAGQINDGVKNPSPTDIKHWLDAMNNEERFYFNVETPAAFITLTNVNSDRVWFHYEDSSKGGILTDPMYTADDGEIEFEGDPTNETIHLYSTVTKTKAYEVIVYFLEHDSLPEGLNWIVSKGSF